MSLAQFNHADAVIATVANKNLKATWVGLCDRLGLPNVGNISLLKEHVRNYLAEHPEIADVMRPADSEKTRMNALFRPIWEGWRQQIVNRDYLLFMAEIHEIDAKLAATNGDAGHMAILDFDAVIASLAARCASFSAFSQPYAHDYCRYVCFVNILSHLRGAIFAYVAEFKKIKDMSGTAPAYVVVRYSDRAPINRDDYLMALKRCRVPISFDGSRPLAEEFPYPAIE